MIAIRDGRSDLRAGVFVVECDGCGAIVRRAVDHGLDFVVLVVGVSEITLCTKRCAPELSMAVSAAVPA